MADAYYDGLVEQMIRLVPYITSESLIKRDDKVFITGSCMIRIMSAYYNIELVRNDDRDMTVYMHLKDELKTEDEDESEYTFYFTIEIPFAEIESLDLKDAAQEESAMLAFALRNFEETKLMVQMYISAVNKKYGEITYGHEA